MMTDNSLASPSCKKIRVKIIAFGFTFKMLLLQSIYNSLHIRPSQVLITSLPL